MATIHADQALLPSCWASDVRVLIEDGRIEAVETGVQARPGDERAAVLVPAMPNLHSHAFQRAMAGMAEVRGPGDDSFWSWRTEMYRFALTMSPDQMQAVAAQLYMEMLEAGFGRVGEFHYVHNRPDGGAYDDPAELAGQIAAASAETGIRLTLLPVFYAHSNFGGVDPLEGQRRFVLPVDRFADLIARCRTIVAGLEDARLGLAPHSLRAVTGEQLGQIVPLAEGGPVHIHVAEQTREVEDSLAWSGARPVQWLLANAPVDGRWCLIHATHMTEAETRAMAASGAVAGLCPITEANLGDGIFDATTFREAGGSFGIGSDSNIDIALAGELRQLEYSQRLGRRARNVIAPASTSTGRTLFDAAYAGGGQALAAPVALRAGSPADLVSLSIEDAPWLAGDGILDAFVFAGGVRVDSVWTGGVKRVGNGRHVHREAIAARFRAAMKEMLSR